MENSEISWTDDTFNPIIGCTKVSPGCAACYAERDMASRLKVVTWGPKGTRVLTGPKGWADLLKWNDNVPEGSKKRLVFVASLSDVFEEWDGALHTMKGERVLRCPDCTRMGPQDELDWFYEQGQENGVQQVACSGCGWRGDIAYATYDHVRARLFDTIRKTPRLLYQLLTKRPENILRFWPVEDPFGNRVPDFVSNVGLGITVEDQARCDQRVRHAAAIRDLCPALFLSCEPLLGRIDLSEWLLPDVQFEPPLVDLVIVGGESGPNARPTHPNWFRHIRDQCQEAGVAFHFKQWGEWVGGLLFKTNGQLCVDGFDGNVYRDVDRKKIHSWDEGRLVSYRVGKKNCRPLLDGIAHTTRLNEV